MSFLLLLMFTLQPNWRKGQNRFCLEAREMGGGQQGEMAPKMYAPMNKK
jgi:hypothetical protein